MVQALSKTLTLEEFLKRPETRPASEYIDGQIIQKPMPQGKHSRIQGEFVPAINEVVKPLEFLFVANCLYQFQIIQFLNYPNILAWYLSPVYPVGYDCHVFDVKSLTILYGCEPFSKRVFNAFDF